MVCPLSKYPVLKRVSFFPSFKIVRHTFTYKYQQMPLADQEHLRNELINTVTPTSVSFLLHSIRVNQTFTFMHKDPENVLHQTSDCHLRSMA